MSIPEFVGAQAIDKTNGDDLTTGATVTVRFGSGTFGAPTNTPVHVADGYWGVTLTTAERANDMCEVKVTHASGITDVRTYPNRNPDGGKVDSVTNPVDTSPVTVGTNNDKTGYTVSGGTIDTCTTNTDMRGTDNASTHSAADVWAVGGRTITGGTVDTCTTNTDMRGTDGASTHSAADVWNVAVDGLVTAAESMRLQNSDSGGKTSGSPLTSFQIRDLADTKNRVTATVDSNGNRTTVVRDLT